MWHFFAGRLGAAGSALCACTGRVTASCRRRRRWLRHSDNAGDAVQRKWQHALCNRHKHVHACRHCASHRRGSLPVLPGVAPLWDVVRRLFKPRSSRPPSAQVLSSHHATVVRTFAFINGYGGLGPDMLLSSTSPVTCTCNSKLTAVARMLGIGRLGGLPVDATPVPIQACSSIRILT